MCQEYCPKNVIDPSKIQEIDPYCYTYVTRLNIENVANKWDFGFKTPSNMY